MVPMNKARRPWNRWRGGVSMIAMALVAGFVVFDVELRGQGFRLSAIRSASSLNSTVMPCSASASMIATTSTGEPSRSGSNAPR